MNENNFIFPYFRRPKNINRKINVKIKTQPMFLLQIQRTFTKKLGATQTGRKQKEEQKSWCQQMCKIFAWVRTLWSSFEQLELQKNRTSSATCPQNNTNLLLNIRYPCTLLLLWKCVKMERPGGCSYAGMHCRAIGWILHTWRQWLTTFSGTIEARWLDINRYQEIWKIP